MLRNLAFAVVLPACFAAAHSLAAPANACMPGDTPAAGTGRILIISGNVESPEEQVHRLRRALQRAHVPRSYIELQIVNESDPSRIVAQLDRARLSASALLVTLSGHIAVTLAKMELRPPTVFATIADPLVWDIVDDLGPRKRNVTGVTYAVDLEWKYLEALRLGFPRVRRAGVLADKYFFDRPIVREIAAESRRRIGIEIVPFAAETREELEAAFRDPRARGVEAWIVPETPVVFRHEERVLQLVGERPIPNIYGHPSLLKKGALMTFGVEFPEMWDEVAKMIAMICRGIEAREIPVVRPHRVFLGVSATNLRARGLDVDPRIYRLATFWH